MKKYFIGSIFNTGLLVLCLFLSVSLNANPFSFINTTKEIKNSDSKYENLRARIVTSFLNRLPDSIIYKDEAKSKKWNYEQGLILEAFRQVWLSTNDKKYLTYIQKNIDHYVKDDGTIDSYRLEEFNIDNVAPGRALLFLYQMTKLEKYRIAAETLRKQLKEQPRTNEGGFWHKKIYPYQMWLDGLYMGEPFYAMYSKNFNELSSFDDIANQFIFAYTHTLDKKTGLLYHAWDESKKQKWANPVTGQSPHFWSRAIGWYMMALVDVLDFFPAEHPKRIELIEILKNLSVSLVKIKDSKTDLWYQIINLPNRKGNYIEASGSCMFIYAFVKGANKGYLDQKFVSIAEKSFDGVMKYLTSEDQNGNINLLHTCQGAGLGGNPYRDGSFEYYIGELQRTNDFKGCGSFILAVNELVKSETIKNSTTGKGKVIGLDYYYNNEWKDGKQFHYVWEDTLNSGYSELGKIITNYGAAIERVPNAPTSDNLKKLSAYIIVDPDTPLETEKPNYIEEAAIRTILEWVKKGGVLVLMANDSNNCEFEHLNNLSMKFGIKFNGDSKNKVTGKNFDMGAFTNLPPHPLFKDVRKIYMKEISTISLKLPARAILKDKSFNIIAEANYGKGYVYAVGDPWFYNEYIDNRKIPEGFDNYQAAKNYIKWILEKSKITK
jgi:unsaturated rhamnogalacturonyl hydrolase